MAGLHCQWLDGLVLGRCSFASLSLVWYGDSTSKKKGKNDY